MCDIELSSWSLLLVQCYWGRERNQGRDCSSAPEKGGKCALQLLILSDRKSYSRNSSITLIHHTTSVLAVHLSSTQTVSNGYGHTFPKATEGEKGAPALLGVDGLVRGGLYPETQLGENLGLVVAGLEGLKLSTLWPCRGDDWAGAGVSFFSVFWGGEA